MTRRYTILLAFTLCAYTSIQYAAQIALDLTYKITAYDLDVPAPDDSLDAEGRIARAIKIPLTSSQQYDLELIPSVSSAIAIQIIAAKGQIAADTVGLSKSDQYKALLRLRGIGEIKAKEIVKFLDLDL